MARFLLAARFLIGSTHIDRGPAFSIPTVRLLKSAYPYQGSPRRFPHAFKAAIALNFAP